MYRVKQGEEIKADIAVAIAKLMFAGIPVRVLSRYPLGRGVATERSTFNNPLDFLQYVGEQQKRRTIEFRVTEANHGRDAHVV